MQNINNRCDENSNNGKRRQTEKKVNIPQYYVMDLKESKVHVLENEPKFCFSISAYCFGN